MAAPKPEHRPLHLDPLAYAVGLQGIALMRAFAGEHDAAFVEDRLRQIAGLLADRAAVGPAVDLPQLTVAEGYDAWSTSYDDPGNGLLGPDLARVTALIDDHPGGIALDIACGTGRYAQWLSERGYRVIGVDGSEGMLEVARAKLPDVDFRIGDLDALPVEAASADLAVCALALTHVEHLDPVYRELARVLRAGGRLVVSDTHPLFLGASRYPLVRQLPDGSFGWMPGWAHSVADHLAAASRAGFVIDRVDEFVLEHIIDPRAEPEELRSAPLPEPWSLMARDPVAANAAHVGRPAALYLQVHRPETDDPAPPAAVP